MLTGQLSQYKLQSHIYRGSRCEALTEGRIPSDMNNPTRNSTKIYNELPSDDAHTGWPSEIGLRLPQDYDDHSVGDESDPNELFITYAEHGRRQ